MSEIYRDQLWVTHSKSSQKVKKFTESHPNHQNLVQIMFRPSHPGGARVPDVRCPRSVSLLCSHKYTPSLFVLTDVDRSCVELHRADQARQEVKHRSVWTRVGNKIYDQILHEQARWNEDGSHQKIVSQSSVHIQITEVEFESSRSTAEPLDTNEEEKGSTHIAEEEDSYWSVSLHVSNSFTVSVLLF